MPDHLVGRPAEEPRHGRAHDADLPLGVEGDDQVRGVLEQQLEPLLPLLVGGAEGLEPRRHLGHRVGQDAERRRGPERRPGRPDPPPPSAGSRRSIGPPGGPDPAPARTRWRCRPRGTRGSRRCTSARSRILFQFRPPHSSLFPDIQIRVKMTLIGAVLPVFLSALAPASVQQDATTHDSAAVVRRVAATATLAAQEYAIGVVNGAVVAAAEVEEARLFLEEARRSAGTLPADGATAVATLDSLLALVRRHGPADSLAASVRLARGRALAALRRCPRRDPRAHARPRAGRGDLPRQLRRLPRRSRSRRRHDGGRARSGAREPGRLALPPRSIASRFLSAREHRRRRHLDAGLRGPPPGPASAGPWRSTHRRSDSRLPRATLPRACSSSPPPGR